MDGMPPDGNRLFSRRKVLKGVGVTGLGLSGLTGTVNADTTPQSVVSGTVEKMSANPDRGFNFPYFIYVPPTAGETTGPLLMEPVNSGTPSDDFQDDLDAAQRTISTSVIRTISDKLSLPAIVPAFPNPRTGSFGEAFTQYLDVETMEADTGELAGLDEQVLAMADDAMRRLSEQGVETTGELALNGFSASGNFVNKLAALHPHRIGSVTAGAINGTAILPKAELNGDQLNYQIGVGNLDTLTGAPFDKDAWQDIEQYLYIGREEQRPIDDTLPYPGVWARDHAQTAIDVYGQDMQEERMPVCERAYTAADSPTRFDVFDGAGHAYTQASIRRSVGVHAQRANISIIEPVDAPTATDPTVTVGAVAALDTTERAEIRIFNQAGEDRTSQPAQLPTGQYHERTVEAEETLEKPTVAVVPTTDPALANAVVATTISSPGEIGFEVTPASGDTEVSVEYEIAPEYDSRTTLSVYTEADRWSRIGLTQLEPGDSGTETFDLSTAEPGVPFDTGEEIELWLHPPGVNLSRSNAVVTTTTTVVGDGGSVAVVEQPTPEDRRVLLETELAERFNTPAAVEATGPDGATETIGTIHPGTAGAQTYTLSNTVTGQVGEQVTLALETPESDRTPLDTATLTILSDSVVVAADEVPVAGTQSVDVRYRAPSQRTSSTKSLRVISGDGEPLGATSISDTSGDTTTVPVELSRQLQIGESLTFRIVTETGKHLAESSEQVGRTQTAEVGVGSKVKSGDPVVELESTLTEDFPSARGRTRVFVGNQTGSYGLGIGYPTRGGTQTETRRFSGLNVSTGTIFSPGKRMEFRLFPSDWSRLSDVVAIDQTIVEGVSVDQFPEENAPRLSVQLGYDETRTGAGTLRLTADGTTLMEWPVLPGTRGVSALELDRKGLSQELTAGTSLGLSLLDADGDRIQRTETVVSPATLRFTSPPRGQETTVALEYDIAEIGSDEPLSVRAYPEQGSSYGIHVGEVSPGTAASTIFTIEQPGIGVPFEAETRLTVAIVAPDDPFAKEPVAAVTATVESDSSTAGEDRYDFDGDGQVGFTDVLGAIDAYNDPEGSPGREMTFTDVLEAISRYNR